MLSESFLSTTCLLLAWRPCSLTHPVSCTSCLGWGWGVSVLPVHMLSVCSPPVLQKEEYHTHLAVLYLDEVLQQRPGTPDKGAEVTETQAKLRRLLQESDLYRVHFLMGKWIHLASVDKRQRVVGGKGQSLSLCGTKSASWRPGEPSICPLPSGHGQGPLASDPEAAQGAGRSVCSLSRAALSLLTWL